MSQHSTKHIIEAALLTAGKPLSLAQLQAMLSEDETPLDKQFVLAALDALADDLEGRGVELRQVASGYRLQVKQAYEPWVARLFEERPPRYSRALLETLALIAYRQPITRAEIEDVRGVSVSSNIVKTLLEREWVKVVGQRDVPGRPSMYGTTKVFLDYFNVKSVSELPPLDELMDLDKIDKQLDMLDPEAAEDTDSADSENADATVEPQAAADADAAGPVEQNIGELGRGEADDGRDHGDRTDPSSEADATDDAGTDSAEVAVEISAEADSATEENTGHADGDVTQPVQLPDADAESALSGDDQTGRGQPDEPGDNGLDLGLEPSEDAADGTADIDSLVNMLDALDQPQPADTAAVGDSDLDADGVSSEPSTLARGGDTAAAVEAARLALAGQALDTLDSIAGQDATSADQMAESRAGSLAELPDASDPAANGERIADDADTAFSQSTSSESDSPDGGHGGDGSDVAANDTDHGSPDDAAPSDAHIASLLDADSRNHEAARGESITPADSLRRSPTDTTD